MKELALKRRLNTYLQQGSPWIFGNIENSGKQLEARPENGVAYKKRVPMFETLGTLGLWDLDF